MVAINNLGIRPPASAENTLSNILEIARGKMSAVKTSGAQENQEEKALEINELGVSIPGAVNQVNAYLTLMSLALAKTTAPIAQVQLTDSAQIEGQDSEAHSQRQDSGRTSISGQSMPAVTALVQKGDVTPDLKIPAQTDIVGDEVKTSPVRKLAEAHVPIEGTHIANKTLPNIKLMSAETGPQTINRQPISDFTANVAPETRSVNTGATMNYTFHSVQGNPNVQVAAGNIVTMLPSNAAVSMNLNDHLLEGYLILPTPEEKEHKEQRQRQQEPDEDQVNDA